MATRKSVRLSGGLKESAQDRNRRRLKANAGRVAADSHAALARNDPAPRLRSERWPLDRLTTTERRSRHTSPAQLERVTRSISQFGILKPILITASGQIVDGHIIVEAARHLGLPDMECVIIDHLSKDELRLARIALNRIQETGEWDLEELSVELEDLQAANLDITLSGFDPVDLDLILNPGKLVVDLDDDLPVKPKMPVSQGGDIWHLGDHRLLCGNSLDPACYEALLEGRKVNCVVSDPPYNIKIQGVVSGLGKVKHQDFAMGVGEMTDAQFRAFLGDYLKLCKEHASPATPIFAFMDWRQVDLLMLAGRDAGLHRINKAIWHKGTGGMGSLYRSAYEEVVVFCTAPSPTTNNVLLGKNGRNRSNVWAYPGANTRGSTASKALDDHPTPKPVELVADAIQDVTQRGDLVFDPFMGSGTTIIAAEVIGRTACGIELDPGYVDVAIARWQEMSGKQAIHAQTGQSFTKLGARRQKKNAPVEGFRKDLPEAPEVKNADQI